MMKDAYLVELGIKRWILKSQDAICEQSLNTLLGQVLFALGKDGTIKEEYIYYQSTAVIPVSEIKKCINNPLLKKAAWSKIQTYLNEG